MWASFRGTVIQGIGRVTVSHFINNTAFEGGAMYLSSANMSYHNLTCTGNSASALAIVRSSVRLHDVRVENNVGESGGGIKAQYSSVFFSGTTMFERNIATNSSGGAILAIIKTNLSFVGVITFTNNIAYYYGGALKGIINTEISISGYCLFLNNTAVHGGAIFASQTNVILSDLVNFILNRGSLGGAMHFYNGATLTLKQNVTVISSNNYASIYGGFLMHTDSITPFQCTFKLSKVRNFMLPACFIQFEGLGTNNNESLYSIHSTDDSAGVDGSFIYGGLMDKCQVVSHVRVDKHIWNDAHDLLWNIVWGHNAIVFDIQSRNNFTKKVISSEAFVLCLCGRRLDCSNQMSMTVYRGQKFSVTLLALSQGDFITSTLVSSILSPTARLVLNQSVQVLPEECTELKYNLYSTKEDEKLLLFTNSSCRDTGLASAIINVKFRDCPKAFILAGDQCVCEKRLQAYQAKCKIHDGEDEIFILRTAEQHFWVSALYLNISYKGLILAVSYLSCPILQDKSCQHNIGPSRHTVWPESKWGTVWRLCF